MARLLMSALCEAGFDPRLASECQTYDGIGSESAQRAYRDASEAEAERLLRQWRAAPAEDRPRLWFTYHVYYKAPDWLGPLVSQELGIPYAVAEASRATKRANGPWAFAHNGAEDALDHADTVFVITEADREALLRSKPDRQRLVDLPPFHHCRQEVHQI